MKKLTDSFLVSILAQAFFILFVGLCSLDAQATYNLNQAKKFCKVDVEFADGEVKKDILAGFPIDNSDKKLILKKNENASKDKIDPDEVNSITIYADNGTFTLIRKNIINNPTKKKVSKYKAWLLPRLQCENFTAYIGVAGFSLDRNMVFYEEYVDAMGGYYVQNANEKYPTKVAYIFVKKLITEKAFNKQRKKMLAMYFAGDAKMQKYLSGKSNVTQEEMFSVFKDRCE